MAEFVTAGRLADELAGGVNRAVGDAVHEALGEVPGREYAGPIWTHEVGWVVPEGWETPRGFSEPAGWHEPVRWNHHEYRDWCDRHYSDDHDWRGWSNAHDWDRHHDRHDD